MKSVKFVPKAHNPEIDILRGLAILLVLFRHSHYALPTFITKYPMILQGTWSGVDLFFLISGFVISISLIPAIRGVDLGMHSAWQVLKSFFVRRVYRLLPVSLVALGANLFFAFFYNHSGQFGNWSAMKSEILPIIFYYYNYLIYLGGSSELSWYWSLSIEEQFYALYPFALLAIRKDKIRLAVFAAVIIAITFMVRPLTTPDFASVNQKLWPKFTTPSHLRFDCILGGCLLGIIYFQGNFIRMKEFFSRSKNLSKIFALASLFMVATAGAILPRLELTGYPIILLFSGILVLLASFQIGVTPTFGCKTALNWLGRRSYSIYLIHMAMIHLVNETWFRVLGKTKFEITWLQGAAGLLLALGTSLILAEIVYQLIEKRFIRMGRSISEEILASKSIEPQNTLHLDPITQKPDLIANS